jgi:ribosomal protein S18 acetylase RimI-like enzyme
MIELRVLGPEDWRLWRDLRLTALAEAPDAFGATLADWQGERDQEARWRGRLGIAGSHNVVALAGNRPLGMASGMPADEPDVVELISLWVSPDIRGRGVGDRLIEEVVRWGRRSGATTLRLSVLDDNRAALALYKRHGFRDSGAPAPVDATRRKLFLEKPLRDPAPERTDS